MKDLFLYKVTIISLTLAVNGHLLAAEMEFVFDSNEALEKSHNNQRFKRGGRFYAGIGAGKTTLDPNPGSTGFQLIDDTGVGGKLMLGYEITNHVAVEAFGATLDTSTLIDANSVREDIDHTNYGLSGVFNFRGLQDGFSPLLKLGANRIKTSTNTVFEHKDDWLFFGGLGLEYEFKNHLALRTEYDFFSKDVQMLSLNVIKYFGSQKPNPNIVATSNTSTSTVATPAPISEPAPAVAISNAKSEVKISPPDTDRDGVDDIQDACPNTPDSAKVDKLGCAQFEGIMQGVNFGPNNARLTPAAKKVLDSIAVDLKNFPQIKIQVKAHTDSKGSPGFNLWLSNSRAQAVIAYLGKQGIDSARMIPIGFGEADPLADNATEEGRATNRRVELKVTTSK
jgi:OOP family OmpA-OmpF porin